MKVQKARREIKLQTTKIHFEASKLLGAEQRDFYKQLSGHRHTSRISQNTASLRGVVAGWPRLGQPASRTAAAQLITVIPCWEALVEVCFIIGRPTRASGKTSWSPQFCESMYFANQDVRH